MPNAKTHDDRVRCNTSATPEERANERANTCRADHGGYGLCLRPLDHDGIHRDATGNRFTVADHELKRPCLICGDDVRAKFIMACMPTWMVGTSKSNEWERVVRNLDKKASV